MGGKNTVGLTIEDRAPLRDEGNAARKYASSHCVFKAIEETLTRVVVRPRGHARIMPGLPARSERMGTEPAAARGISKGHCANDEVPSERGVGASEIVPLPGSDARSGSESADARRTPLNREAPRESSEERHHARRTCALRRFLRMGPNLLHAQ
jgi:hypothetical protein